jgi:hypothetical protein
MPSQHEYLQEGHRDRTLTWIAADFGIAATIWTGAPSWYPGTRAELVRARAVLAAVAPASWPGRVIVFHLSSEDHHPLSPSFFL